MIREISQETFDRATNLLTLISDINEQIKSVRSMAEKQALIAERRHIVSTRRRLLGVED